MADKIEIQKGEVLPSVKEIGDRLAELIKNSEYKDMISEALHSLLEYKKASQEKIISSGAKDAIKTIYDLIRK